MRRLITLLILLAVFLPLIVPVQSGPVEAQPITVDVQSPGDVCNVSGHGTDHPNIVCDKPTPTATPTNTPTATPTNSPTATPVPPTATPLPPTATLVPTVNPSTHEGVPVCISHSKDLYHSLVERDNAGNILCTYTHEHRDDPYAVDHIFGAPSAWYGGTQSISYPWQTVSTFGTENEIKHEGYKWYVRENLPCIPAGGFPPGCITAYRAMVHTMGNVSDQITQFHSFSLEALIRDPRDGHEGIVRGGGHMDTGHLALLSTGPQLCPPISTNPPTFTCGANEHRESSSINMPNNSSHQTAVTNWYASHRTIQVGPQLELWGPMDYQNPTGQLFFNNTHGILNRNNSVGRLENLSVTTLNQPFRFLTTGAPEAVGSRVNGFWYVDRNGLVSINNQSTNAVCTASGAIAPSIDCIPFVAEDAPSVTAFQNAATHALIGAYSEGDVASPVTGRSLIRFPN